MNTEATQQENKNGLILSGGGARAAYQVGVLKAIAELLPKHAPNPFPVICGTSAGAINTAAIAIYGKRFQHSVMLLLRVWRNFHVDHVFRTDYKGAIKNSLHWFGSLFLASLGKKELKPVTLFDRAPLRALLSRYLPCERISESIANGTIESIGIVASSYGTGTSIAFYESSANIKSWSRARRVGRSSEITQQHLLASSAIPLVFRAIKIGNDYFGDGSMRQTAPLSAAIHLGANNLLVIGLTNQPGSVGDNNDDLEEEMDYPSLGKITGHILNSIFMDSMEADLERVERVNKTIDLIPSHHLEEHDVSLRPINVLVISPSKDLQYIAIKHLMTLPRSLRFLLRSLGALGKKGGSLVSYLMFEKEYCRELIELGYQDAMERKEEIKDFLSLK